MTMTKHMKRALLLTMASVLLTIAAVAGETAGCHEDALICPDGGGVVVRDPKLNCEFPACPANPASPAAESGDKDTAKKTLPLQVSFANL